jgi:2-phosphosulfolactate phosphatase
VRVDVALTPALLPAGSRAHVDVVVIDVLRATTTIAAALASGALGVRPEGSLDAATAAARSTGALLGGEREGLPPRGFDLGNSPAAYTAERCRGRDVVLSTTNGTQASLAAAGCRSLRAGCLVNAEATCRALVAGGATDVLLLCAGTRTRVAADDAAAAGCMAGSLLLMAAAELTDAARLAVALFDAWKHDLPGLLRRCESGQRLLRIDLAGDIADCARVDALPVAVRLDAQGVFRRED